MAIEITIAETIIDTGVTLNSTTVELAYPGPQGAPGDVANLQATAPITRTLTNGTATIGIDQTGLTLSKTQITGTAVTLADNATITNQMLAGSIDPTKIIGTAADLGDNTFTGKQTLPSSTTAQAFLNLGQGTTPTSPTNGDVWIRDTGNLAWRAGGLTYQAAPLTSPNFAGTVTVSTLNGTTITAGTITATAALNGTATAALTSDTATFATSATTASTATYAINAGTSTYSTLSGTAVYASSAGTATGAGTATTAGTASYAANSGTAVYATNSGTAVYATNAGTAVYATTSGTAAYGTLSGTATYATNSGTAVYATNAGTSVYATNAGTAVNISGTIAPTQVTGTAVTAPNFRANMHAPSGAMEINNRISFTNTSGAITNGRVTLTGFTPVADFTFTTLAMYVSSGGTDTGGTTVRRMGIYTESGGTFTLVARTASDATLFTNSTSLEARVLDSTGGYPSSYTLTAGTRYYFAFICYNTGGTYSGPSFPCSVSFGLSQFVASLSPILVTHKATQTDLAATITSTVTTSNLVHWGRLS